MNIVQWFDPSNTSHVKAYQSLVEDGCWPKDFLPDDIEMGEEWMGAISSKIALFHARNVKEVKQTDHPVKDELYEYLKSLANDQNITKPIGFKRMAKQIVTSANFAGNLIDQLIAAKKIEVFEPRIGTRGARYRILQ